MTIVEVSSLPSSFSSSFSHSSPSLSLFPPSHMMVHSYLACLLSADFLWVDDAAQAVQPP